MVRTRCKQMSFHEQWKRGKTWMSQEKKRGKHEINSRASMWKRFLDGMFRSFIRARHSFGRSKNGIRSFRLVFSLRESALFRKASEDEGAADARRLLANEIDISHEEDPTWISRVTETSGSILSLRVGFQAIDCIRTIQVDRRRRTPSIPCMTRLQEGIIPRLHSMSFSKRGLLRLRCTSRQAPFG